MSREEASSIHAEQTIAHTRVLTSLCVCPKCGRAMAERDEVRMVREDGSCQVVGSVMACPECDTEHWMFHSHMPKHVRMQALRDRSVV